MTKEELLNAVEKCAKCGGCKAKCTTFGYDETELGSPRARLVLLREFLLGRLKPTKILNERIFSCILCEACVSLCPDDIDITGLICQGRSYLKKYDRKNFLLRTAMKVFFKFPYLSLKTAQIFYKIFLPYLAKKGLLPKNFSMHPAKPERTTQVFKPERTKGRVAFFTGCNADFLFPNLVSATINVLLKAGYEVIIPSGTVCCGSPFRMLGMEEEAVAAAKKNIRIFNKLNVEAVVSFCPACTFTIKNDYQRLIGEEINNAVDISKFLFDKLDMSELHPMAVKAVYHDPCHLIHGLKVKNEPREILKKTGVNLIETESACCGFGGLYSFTNKELSKNLLQNNASQYANAGADLLVTACPGCMIQLSKLITNIPVFHVIELLEEAYCGKTDKE